MSKRKHDVLALNKSFVPIHIMTYKKAMLNMVKGSVRSLDTDFVAYDFQDWIEFSESLRADDYPFVRTVKHRIAIPEIIVEKGFNKIPLRDAKYTRQTLFQRDKFTCAYCEKRFPREKLTVDHVVPRCAGGRSTWGNTVTCCRPCNGRKANKALEECGLVLRIKPKKPKWTSPFHQTSHRHWRKSWEKFADKALY